MSVDDSRLSNVGHSVRELPAVDERVETGAVRFGDDWPGLFVRGDSALLGLRPVLRDYLASGSPKAFSGYAIGLLKLIEDGVKGG